MSRSARRGTRWNKKSSVQRRQVSLLKAAEQAGELRSPLREAVLVHDRRTLKNKQTNKQNNRDTEKKSAAGTWIWRL